MEMRSDRTGSSPPEMNLAEQAAFLRSVLDASTEYAIVAKDLHGNILAWNEGARRIYGYEREEVIGRNSRILHVPEDVERERSADALALALDTGKFEGEFQRLRKNGERFTAQVAITLRRDEQQRPIGFVMISKDVSDRKLLEAQLRRKNQELEDQNARVQQANRLKSEFLANMSHELRTPLNGIIGFAQLMHNGKVGPVSAEHKEYLGDILVSAQHLLQLINDVLDLAKVESGKIELRAEPVELARVVAEVRDVLRTITAKKRIKVEVAVSPELTDIIGDPARIKQILYNYLSNAFKFSPDGGRVWIRCIPDDDASYRIEVEDEGIGIRTEDLDRLFVEFQQLDASTAKRYQGTGLGLALTRRLAEAQGGRVEVRSVVGQGSVFSAVLPRILRSTIERTDPVVALVGNEGAPTVLVVEDDPEDRRQLARILGDAGYGVVAVASGAEALAVARTRSFAALTLDLLLPDTSGWQVLDAIRQTPLNANIRAVVITVVQDGANGHGVDDLLIKPVNADDLIRSLRRAGVPPDGGKILVVDDEAPTLLLADTVLSAHGYRPVCIANPLDALRFLEDERPSAMVVDLIMPEMTGFELIERIRANRRSDDVPIIVWTSKELDAEERARLRGRGNTVIAGKSDGLHGLLDEVRRAVGVAVPGPRPAL